MTDVEGAPVDGTTEPTGPVEQASPVDPSPSEQAAHAAEPASDSASAGAVTVPAAAAAEQPPAEQPAEQPPAEPHSQEQLAFDARAPVPDAEAEVAVADEEMPDDLRAVTEALEQPTGELTAVTAAEAATGSETAEGTDGAETAEAAEGAESAEATEGADAATEGAAEPEAGAAPTTAEMLDEIAPGTVTAAEAEGAEAAELAEVEAPVTKVSWWPFVAYVVLWLGAAGYAVWRLYELPAAATAYESYIYTMSMLGGLVLLGLGPLLLLIVWFASWIGRPNTRKGLMFISALLKGATVTLLGAVIWIGALVLIDYLRLGRPF